MRKSTFVRAVAGLSLGWAGIAQGSIIFDNFDVSEGHFGYAPGFSSTSVGEDASSTADRVRIDSVYFRDLDGSPGPMAGIFMDFVAKSDSGTIAALVPEPATMILLAAASVGLVLHRRRTAA